MFERLKSMLRKEFIQIRRDPRMLAVIFVMPVIQSLVLGYAVSTDVRMIRTAVLDFDNSVESREVESRFVGSGYFILTASPASETEARVLVDRGDVKAVLRFNKGFGATMGAGRTAPVQLIVDGSDSNTANVIMKYASGIASDYNRKVVLERAARAGAVASALPIETRSRAWFNENLESRNFYVPGVVVLISTLVTLMLTSMAVVREREIGTIEQIIVTPITRAEFIVGKTLPFALIAFGNVLTVAAFAVFWFGVPIRGNLLTLFAGTAIYFLNSIGIGLFISTVSQTQQQAMMASIFFFMPAVLLSGFMFPIANMPLVVQWLTILNPLRYFLVIVRGVFLKGTGFEVLWPQMAALAILGIAMLWLSTKRFKKTIA